MNHKATVIMCLYNRHNNLRAILSQLTKQTNKNFKFIIWDNSKNKKLTYDIIQNYFDQLDLDIIESPINIGGIGRFYAAAKYADSSNITIFFDDDQKPDQNFIDTMINYYENCTIKSGHAFKLIHPNNYWMRMRAVDNSSFVNYCGTGGMVLSSGIFKEKELFECPKEYSFIEDLWLSYYAQHILKWRLVSINTPLVFMKDYLDQYHKLRNKKNEFLSYLTSNKQWDLNKIY